MLGFFDGGGRGFERKFILLLFIFFMMTIDTFSDEDEDVCPPMSLPTIRPIPASAPVVPTISVFHPVSQPNSRYLVS